MSVAVRHAGPCVGVVLAGALLVHLLMFTGQAATPSLTDLSGVVGHEATARAAAGDASEGDEVPASRHDAQNMLAFCVAIVAAAGTAVLTVAWRRGRRSRGPGGEWAILAGRGAAQLSSDPPHGPPSRIAAGVLLRA